MRALLRGAFAAAGLSLVAGGCGSSAKTSSSGASSSTTTTVPTTTPTTSPPSPASPTRGRLTVGLLLKQNACLANARKMAAQL